MSIYSSQIELLNEQTIQTVMDDTSLSRLGKIEIFESIDSTNQYLLEKSKVYKSGHVCFAEEQTDGRGRHGRCWLSPKGTNIYCSVLWHFLKQDVANLSMAIALMIIDALKKYGMNKEMKVKWPNDIMFEGKKLAGILLEKSGTGVVIGIGLNIFLPDKVKAALEGNATDLCEIMSEPVKRNYLAGLLLNELLTQIPLYEKGGLNAFLEKWHHHDFLIEKKVTIHNGNKNITGVVKGVNESGELLVLHEDEIIGFRCGEVSVREKLSS